MFQCERWRDARQPLELLLSILKSIIDEGQRIFHSIPYSIIYGVSVVFGQPNPQNQGGGKDACIQGFLMVKRYLDLAE